MSDEEEEFFDSDWNDLALDDEMANMVLDNLSFFSMRGFNGRIS